MNVGRIVVVLSVVLTLAVGLHALIWLRLVQDPGWAPGVRRGLGVALLALLLTVPLGPLLQRGLGLSAPRWLGLALFSWWALLFWLFLGTLTLELPRALAWLGERLGLLPPLSDERRRTLAQLGAAAVALGAAGLGVAGAVTVAAGPRIREVLVRLRGLAPGARPLVVAHLTDLHIGPGLRERFVADVVQKTNALGADLIAITGDLVDGSVEELAHLVAPLAQLRAPLGVFFATGNHEFYSGADAWCAELERLGLRVLRNAHAVVRHGDAEVVIAGIDDEGSGSFGAGPDVPRALAGAPPDAPVLLLAHQPLSLRRVASHPVGLMLSGHTHGGQLWPFGWLTQLQQPVVSGLARVDGVQIFVGNGTGFWGPPMRVGAPAEIARLTLVAEG